MANVILALRERHQKAREYLERLDYSSALSILRQDQDLIKEDEHVD